MEANKQLNTTAAIHVHEIQGSVPGLPDFELGNRPRERPITYTLSLPGDYSPENPATGLVFYIPGFGEDNNSAYLKKIHAFIAETYGLAVVSVDYHAILARPEQGCPLMLDPQSIFVLRLFCQQYDLPFDINNLWHICDSLGGILPEPVILKGVLEPPHQEYQNFGVLQALDHLTVLNDLINGGLAFDLNNIILVGSSHGGYIAHLITKFAPNTINAVLDNSSYTRAPFSYLGISKEYFMRFRNLVLDCNLKTHWQFENPSQSDYFGLPQQLIRDTAFPPHLEIMKKQSGRLPHYYCYNSTQDSLSPITEKRLQQKRLESIGCKCNLQEINEGDIDGVIFKTMDHGMNASMKSLCRMVFPHIVPRETTLDRFRKTILEYDGYSQVYRVEHTDGEPWLHLSLRSG